jgi:hypothetical protein
MRVARAIGLRAGSDGGTNAGPGREAGRSAEGVAKTGVFLFVIVKSWRSYQVFPSGPKN